MRVESFDSANGGVVTLGAWIDGVDRRGWGDEWVWLTLQSAARAALGAVRRLLRPGEDDEFVSEVIERARCLPMSWREPQKSAAALAAWLGGVMKNVLRERRRRAARERSGILPHLVPETVRRGSSHPARTSLSALRARHREHATHAAIVGSGGAVTRAFPGSEFLTHKQVEAYELKLRGLTEKSIASTLGISRSAVHDRLRRARQRIQRGLAAPRSGSASDARRLAEQVSANGDMTNAALLRHRANGLTYAAIAEALQMTPGAVAGRLKRLWQKAAPSMAPKHAEAEPRTSPADTSQARRSLACGRGTVEASSGGAPDGHPRDPLFDRGDVPPDEGHRGRDPP